ncbi:hypothetical protein BST95_01700 [Halioglobus japonicus]|uniref:DM13 domain-containing protein n=1 Tax=Halioglobus japonicus TaxID=930805 RepID=A0AAP8MC08_9GAMM|nr:DM13 domain-containing protein [Halioglobus japonicus]AQA17119.1 hypothetical protein BST95_01700 [Halioglobus japonicus]PLW85028.1 hypothetical protein C0029_15965 [Halioglobus japonicus]GHD19101.1 hypothetical protein GCM10007052_27170 [Halioglobus japonicus]
MRALLLVASHIAVAIFGFMAGIFALPILMAPDAPQAETVAAAQVGATYTGEFRRDLKDSDFLHWGEGVISVGPDAITLLGQLAPGPAYKLYLSPEFVETETGFEAIRSSMVQVGPVDTFENFIVPVGADIDLERYNTVIIWCESFSQFITAARYR